MAQLPNFVGDIWHCNDERFPKTEDIMRTPPEASFVCNIIKHGQLQHVLMCHNDQDGWFMGFGRRRLLAIREAFETLDEQGIPLHDGSVLVRIGEGLTKNDGHIFALIENAQRNGNPISDYIAIRELLLMPGTKTYKEIAEQLNVTVSYVKQADEKFAKVPTWALEGALNDTIALSTAISIGKFSSPKQREVKKIFTKNGKLTGGDVKEMNRAIRKDMVVQVSNLPGMVATPDEEKRQFFNRDELVVIEKALKKGDYPHAKALLTALLDQKE